MNQYYSEKDYSIPREAFYEYAQAAFLRNNQEHLKAIIQMVANQHRLTEADYDIEDLIKKVAFGVVHEFFCTEISNSMISVYELCRKHILYILL